MSKLYQQNKNTLLRIEKRVSSTKIKKTLSSRVSLSSEYYGIRFKIWGSLKFTDFIWEESQGKFYLLSSPKVVFQTFGSQSTSKKEVLLGDLDALIKFCIKLSIKYKAKSSSLYEPHTNAIEKLCLDAKCTEDDIKDYISGTNSSLQTYLSKKIGPVVTEVLNLNTVVLIHNKVFPNIKDRTRVPILYYEPDTQFISFIRWNYDNAGASKSALVSSKAWDKTTIKKFMKYYTESCWNNLPLERWLDFEVEKIGSVLGGIILEWE